MTKAFKALETYYHGYRFRSRQEARWAVFFDQLGINYRYEPEGYLVEGRGYLPDFYLTQQDCFIEIKPRLPDKEALEKTRLLVLYTGKEMYTLFGDVWHAQQPIQCQACRYTPPKIYAIPQTNRLDDESLKQEIAGFQDVKVLLQKLDDAGLTVLVQEEYVSLSSTFHFDSETFRAQRYLADFQGQYHRLAELSSQLQMAYDALREAFTEQAGWKRVFARQQLSWDFAWAECSACGDLSLQNEREEDEGDGAALLHDHCPRRQPGRYTYDSPRLRAAYEKARQERFST